MKRSVRTSAAMLATGLVLAACGTAEDAAPATEPVAVTAPSASGSDDDLTQNEGSSSEGTAAAAEPVDDAAAPSTPDEPAETEAATTDPAPAADVPATDAPAAPVAAVLGGRALAAALAAESDYAENYLPDLLVDDIRSGQKVNLRNVFPAERPVLFWMWAPH